MAFVYDNNVQCTLNTAINAVVTSIKVNAAVAPNRSPVAPTGGNSSVITLMDTLISPTKIEVITYTTSTNNGDGTFTLTGCTRGQEGFTAQSFSVGAACIGALTAGMLAALVPTGNSTLLQFCGVGAGNYTASSSTLVLTSDTYYANVTLSGTAKINTNGFGLYVSGVTDLTAAPVGAIFAPSGANGTTAVSVGGGAGGAGATAGTVPGGSNGGSGAAATLTGGNAITPVAAFGGYGGYGGKPSGGPAQGAGAQYPPVNFSSPARPGTHLAYPISGVLNLVAGGLGGGGGSANAAQGGGGGGGGGGALIFYSATILTSASTPAGVIQGGRGGDGGIGFNSGGCGGGGGGGPAVVGYGTRIGPTISNGITSTGGDGSFSSFTPSIGGGWGSIFVFNLLTGAATQLGPSAGSPGFGDVGNANL